MRMRLRAGFACGIAPAAKHEHRGGAAQRRPHAVINASLFGVVEEAHRHAAITALTAHVTESAASYAKISRICFR